MPLVTSTAWANFKERQGDTSPSKFRVGKGGGVATMVGTVTAADLATIEAEGIENARASDDPFLAPILRTLPVAHPKRPWLFLRTLDDCTGVTFAAKTSSAIGDTYPTNQVLPSFAEWVLYQITATFDVRGYQMIENYYLPKTDPPFTYYNTAGTLTTYKAGVTEIPVWHEWERYREWFSAPGAQYLKADFGQYRFSLATIDLPAGDPADNTSAGTGQVRILVPMTKWKLRWTMVPYEFVLSENSLFSSKIGHVNQKSWEGFAPGHLLLEGVNVTDVYTAPYPRVETNYTGSTYLGQAKLCDLEFDFLEADRTAIRPPTPTNLNHIVDGHNSVIYARSMKPYYIEGLRTGAVGTGLPVYPSFPFELLFQNPD